LLGTVLWLVAVALLVTTEAVNLIPTVIMLGSFLVPVTAVVFYMDHDPSPVMQPQTVVNAFLVGGLLGVYGALALEALFVDSGPLRFFWVGFIEEGAKLLALVVVARGLPRYQTRDGVVLGAAVGFGFAALESSGYAFAASLTKQGLSIGDLLMTEVLRALLAPVGHGLWTGIVGGALFRAAGPVGHLRLTWGVVGAYLFASVLHGLWDSMNGLAVIFTLLFTATPAQRLALRSGGGFQVSPDQVQTVLYLLFYWGGLLVVSVVGLLRLRALWRLGAQEARPAPELRPA
jgi:RsiW-degrading membrane proteinase PrsW (M82 family)